MYTYNNMKMNPNKSVSDLRVTYIPDCSLILVEILQSSLCLHHILYLETRTKAKQVSIRHHMAVMVSECTCVG